MTKCLFSTNISYVMCQMIVIVAMSCRGPGHCLSVDDILSIVPFTREHLRAEVILNFDLGRTLLHTCKKYKMQLDAVISLGTDQKVEACSTEREPIESPVDTAIDCATLSSKTLCIDDTASPLSCHHVKSVQK